MKLSGSRRAEKVLQVRARGAVERYEQPALTSAQDRVLDDLRTRGIALASFDELIGDAQLWSELDAEMNGFVDSVTDLVPQLDRPERKDQYLLRRWRPDKSGTVLDDPHLAASSPWLRFAARDTLLDIVNSYRGVYTKVVDLDNWYTVPFPADYDRVASQRWHRDPEDQHVVKCFLYFSDVDEGAGPFEYVARSAPGSHYGELWPWGIEGEWYPPDGELEKLVDPADRVRATGSRGTVVLCDTSGFHRGGHARTAPRILSYHTYISPDAPWEKMYVEIDVDDDAPLSQQARYALT